jgi:hypothetical protein
MLINGGLSIRYVMDDEQLCPLAAGLKWKSSTTSASVMLYNEITTSYAMDIEITPTNQSSLITQLIQAEDTKITQLDKDIAQLQETLTKLEQELQQMGSD